MKQRICHYMPFYGADFFEAMSGYDGDVVSAYLRAIWTYWAITDCGGLDDDDDRLRRICCTDSSDWQRVRGVVFDNRYHFRLEGGKWHQKRAKKEHAKSLEIRALRSLIGKKGNDARWGGKKFCDSQQA